MPRRRFLNRRMFLAQCALTAGAGAWLAWSSSWYARFFRERFAEMGRPIEPLRQRPIPGTWADDRLTFSWLGHATVLVNLLGLRILVDPALFPRIGVDLKLGSLGPKRLTACALRPAELPEIDLVLVTHAHFDHLDTPSLGAVRGKPAAVMSTGTSDLLPRRRYSSVTELRWGESTLVKTSRKDITGRRTRTRHRGQALGCTHPARCLARVRRVRRRTRGTPPAHRRRHGRHARLRGASRARAV